MRVDGDQPVPCFHDNIVVIYLRVFVLGVKSSLKDFNMLEVVLSELIAFRLESPTISDSTWIVLAYESELATAKFKCSG
jgi:hypothetical protein